MTESEITEKSNNVLKILNGLSYADALNILSLAKFKLQSVSIVGLNQE